MSVLPSSPFVGYAYAYPHKTAYRPLERPRPLSEVWAGEGRDALFLYLHVPFCEYRCGFCNLFTAAHPRSDEVARYVDALERESAAVQAALGEHRFARLAIGGGTPTYLDVRELERVLDVAVRLGAARVPASIEVSPGTADAERVALLRERRIHRVSIGVQTFDEAEARSLSRPQRRESVEAALRTIRDAGFPVLNVDLIYGMAGQSEASFQDSLERTLAWTPEEIYLYPLYVRPLTGLGLGGRSWDDQRLALYRLGRSFLLRSGYEQVSMRMFRKSGVPDADGPAYCCQADGMIGLGPAARSYTRGLHYSSEWAVGRASVRSIIESYVERSTAGDATAFYGFELDVDEQPRRWIIQSLLQAEGLDTSAYTSRFGTCVLDDCPGLLELSEAGWVTVSPERLRLTDAGLERSDAVGPYLYSERVRRLIETFALR